MDAAMEQFLKDHPWPKPDVLVRDPITGKVGYVIGHDVTDGACGFMEVFDLDEGDLSGEIIRVEGRHCKLIKDTK